MKTNAVNKFNELKTNAVEKVVGLKNDAVNKVTELKTNFVDKVNEIKTGTIEKFNNLKTEAGTVMGAVKDAIVKPIDKAKELVEKAVDKIKGFFSGLKLKIPKIEMPKLPHFKLKTSSKTIMGKEITYPTGFGVEWYDKGGIFNSPSIIGVGEKRPEFVGALDDLKVIVSESMQRVLSNAASTTNNRNVTNNTPITVNLNYSGSASHTDVMEMVDIIESELTKRFNMRQNVLGVR